MNSNIAPQMIDRSVVDLLKYIIKVNNISATPNSNTISPNQNLNPSLPGPFPPLSTPSPLPSTINLTTNTNPAIIPSIPLLLDPRLFAFTTRHEALDYGRAIGKTLYRRAQDRRFDPKLVLKFIKEVAICVRYEDEDGEENEPNRQKKKTRFKVGGVWCVFWGEVEAGYFKGVREELAGRIELGER